MNTNASDILSVKEFTYSNDSKVELQSCRHSSKGLQQHNNKFSVLFMQDWSSIFLTTIFLSGFGNEAPYEIYRVYVSYLAMVKRVIERQQFKHGGKYQTYVKSHLKEHFLLEAESELF